MLDVNNSKLLADVLLASIIIMSLIVVARSRYRTSATPLVLALLALTGLSIQLTVDIALATHSITGNEQSLTTFILDWRAVLIVLIAGLTVVALLLLGQQMKPLHGTRGAFANPQPTQENLETGVSGQQLGSIRSQQRQRLLGSLTGHVAHQLQNHAAIMLSHLEFAQRELKPDSPLHENLTAMHSSLLLSSQLIRRVAAFEVSHQRSLETIDLVKALRQMTALLVEIAPATATVDVNLAESRLLVKGDSADLQLAMACLVSDALEALPNGHGKVRVSVLSTDAQTASVAVQNSEFSSPADREGNSATQIEAGEPLPGLGSGYPTVAQVVARHGGDIDVTNSQNSGTTITLSFPLLSA